MKPLTVIAHLLLPTMAYSASVVGTSHVGSIGTNIFTVDQEFSSSDDMGIRDYTGFVFTSLGGFSFEYGGSFLDEGASLFFVNPNEIFWETNILARDFVELSIGSIYSLPQNFFLGIRTPAQGVDFGSFSPAYGWVEFQNQGTGELVLVDHAMAYSSQGIVVGTLTAVPEPHSLLLISVAMTLAIRRRRIEQGGGGNRLKPVPHL
jgi:hypothetical protein